MRNLQTHLRQLRERAEKALTLPSPFGPDFDPALYLKEETGAAATGEDLSRRMQEAMLLSGFDPEERDRAGSFMQQNDAVLYEEVGRAYQGQVEIMAIEKALEKYDWLWDYWWQAVPVDADKYTAYAALYQKGGYFIRFYPGPRWTGRFSPVFCSRRMKAASGYIISSSLKRVLGGVSAVVPLCRRWRPVCTWGSRSSTSRRGFLVYHGS